MGKFRKFLDKKVMRGRNLQMLTSSLFLSLFVELYILLTVFFSPGIATTCFSNKRNIKNLIPKESVSLKFRSVLPSRLTSPSPTSAFISHSESHRYFSREIWNRAEIHFRKISTDSTATKLNKSPIHSNSCECFLRQNNMYSLGTKSLLQMKFSFFNNDDGNDSEESVSNAVQNPYEKQSSNSEELHDDIVLQDMPNSQDSMHSPLSETMSSSTSPGIAKKLNSKQEFLKAEAEKLRLKAERVRLEILRDELTLERDILIAKQKKMESLNKIINELRDAYQMVRGVPSIPMNRETYSPTTLNPADEGFMNGYTGNKIDNGDNIVFPEGTSSSLKENSSFNPTSTDDDKSSSSDSLTTVTASERNEDGLSSIEPDYIRRIPRQKTLKEVVGHYKSKLDVDLFLELEDLVIKATNPMQQLANRNFADQVMTTLKEIDKDRAETIAQDVKFELNARLTRERSSNFDEDAAREAREKSESIFNKGLVAGLDDDISFITKPGEGRNLSNAEELDEITKQMLQSFNQTYGFNSFGNETDMRMINVFNLPLWLPDEFRRSLQYFEPLSDSDVNLLKSEVMKQDTFFVTKVDKSPIGVAFKGTFRGKSSEEVYQETVKRLKSIPGLSDRVQLFFFADPSPLTEEQMQNIGQPFADSGVPEPDILFMAISSNVQPAVNTGIGSSIISLLTLGATGSLLIPFSLLNYYSNVENIQDRLNANPLEFLDQAWPIAAALLGIQLLHDGVTQIVASSKKTKMGLPFYFPSLQVGSFGSIMSFKDYPQSRKDLFDISVSGPFIGMLVSIGCLIAGLYITGHTSQDLMTSYPFLQIAFFRSSFLLTILGSLLINSSWIGDYPLQTFIHMHPLVLIGAFGMLTQSLQFMPIGKLDGGRALTAAFGRSIPFVISNVILLAQFISGVFYDNQIQLFYGVLVSFFATGQEVYCKDEVTDIGQGRKILMAIMFFLAFATLAPGVPFSTAVDTGMQGMVS